jgi:hypothetical protein
LLLGRPIELVRVATRASGARALVEPHLGAQHALRTRSRGGARVVECRLARLGHLRGPGRRDARSSGWQTRSQGLPAATKRQLAAPRQPADKRPLRGGRGARALGVVGPCARRDLEPRTMRAAAVQVMADGSAQRHGDGRLVPSSDDAPIERHTTSVRAGATVRTRLPSTYRGRRLSAEPGYDTRRVVADHVVRFVRRLLAPAVKRGRFYGGRPRQAPFTALTLDTSWPGVPGPGLRAWFGPQHGAPWPTAL